MAFEVKDGVMAAKLREAPAADSRSKKTLSQGHPLGEPIRTSGDFIFFDFSDGDENNPESEKNRGWIARNECQEVPAGERPELNRRGFVQECVIAEQQFNASNAIAPWVVVADFLIARAIIETEVRNLGPTTGPDALGPLQVAQAEWDAFRNQAGALASGSRPGDRNFPTLQIGGAAWRMHTDAKKMNELRIAAGKATAEDPFVASYLDVLFAYLTNSPAAALAILDVQSPPGTIVTNRGIDQVLKQPAGPLSDAEFSALLTARSRFFGTSASPKLLSDVVTNAETVLSAALKEAAADIEKFMPEAVPKIAQGEAPWFDVAQKEIGIAEPDQTIVTRYFPGTGINNATPDTPWCGAFANFCMRQVRVDPPAGPARAANWKAWGSEISLQSGDVPQGAVVVLSPSEGTGTSGHVAFFVRFLENGKKVELLGGNQHDSVRLSPFLTSRIAAVRWMDLAPQTKSQDPGGAPVEGVPISQAAIDLIVAAEVTSQAVYQKRYRHPIWPKGMSGVTIGIGYDVGYQSRAQVAEDWNGVIPDAMVARLQTACGVHGDAAGPLARSMGDVDVPFDNAMQVFMRRDVPRWVGIVQRALPNTGELSPNRLGALVSLTYNRGASFAKAGDRYTEMRNIKTHMTNRAFGNIPNEFRSMKRLWPTMAGLQRRRDDEAHLFEIG